ncbi:MAG: DotU family type IV/VI secretion system protein [Planctomycetota bacterium]
MTLEELTSKLFLYLTTFRRNAGRLPMELASVRSRLLEIFDEQEANARRHPEVTAAYEKVRYALVVTADEVILDSDWEHAARWSSQLLEMHYFSTNVAATRFFELLESAEDDPDVARVFYLCIALGFQGKFRGQPDALRQIRSTLSRKLPDRVLQKTDKICPEAYQHTVERDPTTSLGVNLVRLSFAFLGILAFLFVLANVLFNAKTSEIQELAGQGYPIADQGE